MTRTEAVALSLLQATMPMTDPSVRHFFAERPTAQQLECVREFVAPAGPVMEEAERFLVFLHERGWKVVAA